MKKNQPTASSVRLSATSRSQLVTMSVGKLARLVLASTRLVHAVPTCRVRVGVRVGVGVRVRVRPRLRLRVRS